MTRQAPIWLAATFTLTLACGGSGGATASDSLSGGSLITSASASSSSGDTPTTGVTGGMSEATQGSMSGSDSESGEQTSTGEPTGGSSTGGSSTGGSTSTGEVVLTSGTADTNTTSEPCQVENTTINPIPPDLLLVLDKSGSMSMEKWDHDNNPNTATVTRWQSLHGVVKSIVTKFDKTVNFGMKLYPRLGAGSFVDNGACQVTPGVEVPIAVMNAAGVLAVLPPADFEVLGGTPMETGLKEAFKYLEAQDPSKQRFALMVADGEISKTCQGEVYKEALGSVKQAYSKGIPTYVVGIDVDPMVSADLQSLAEAGGKSNPNNPAGFYETKSQTELQAALQQIVDDTLSCVIDVDPEPSEPELFEVWIGAQQIAAAADCTGDGWVWTVPHTQIELCGQACLDLKKSGQVEARYFCEAG